MSAPSINPVRLEGRLDSGLSRWLWLVKWLLAIPHFIVLVFLWIAFFVLTVVAFFAILFTARYPRGIFEFNVGVLRWTWRVAFYSYGALGTDRYPPFTLGAAPDYPATLEVVYPGELSRGLVLVKWWLLAIPHYLILGVFLGGGWFAWGGGWDRGGDDWGRGGGAGLSVCWCSSRGWRCSLRRGIRGGSSISCSGLDRWVARVVAYAGLMTDTYPPFRLDQGGEEKAPGLTGRGAGCPLARERGRRGRAARRQRRGGRGAARRRQHRGAAGVSPACGGRRRRGRRPDPARRRRLPHVANRGLLDGDVRDRLRERRPRPRRARLGDDGLPGDGSDPQRERPTCVRRHRPRGGRRRVP